MSIPYLGKFYSILCLDTIYCGLDIFDNHLFRSNTFKIANSLDDFYTSEPIEADFLENEQSQCLYINLDIEDQFLIICRNICQI